MKNKILSLFKSDNARYISIFRNNHRRIIYLCIISIGELVAIEECEYIDRYKSSRPKKLTTRACELEKLTDVIREELDRDFESVELYSDTVVSKDYLIATFLGSQKKRILIMIAEGDKLKTIFKSKFRREIYLEITLNGDQATITRCYYVDKRAKGLKIPPQGIVTVKFTFSLEKLIEVVNSELEGGFTDAIITHAHTLTLDSPICGAI